MRRAWLVVVVLVVVSACRGGDDPPPPAKPKPAKPHVTSSRAWHDWKLANLRRHDDEKRPAPAPPPPRAWPAGDFKLADELPGAFGSGDAIGTSDRVIGAVGDAHARWAIVCQQREDTDGDGKITLQREEHFSIGDQPSSYLVFGGGSGAELDDVLAVAPDGNHVVVVVDRTPLLVDAAHQTATVLPDAHSASFTLDNQYVEYTDSVDGKPRIVRRTLATGATKAVALAATTPVRVLAGGSGRWALVTVEQEASFQSEPWAAPLSHFCSLHGGESGFGESTRLWIDLEAGTTLTDPNILRPAGDHVFSRAAEKPHAHPTVLLDGKPVGPIDCAELDVLGIVEDPPRALLECMRYHGSDPVFSVELAGPGITAAPYRGFADRFFGPIPPILVGDICPAGSSICFDVATGESHPRVGNAPPTLDYHPREYAIDDKQRRLTEGPDDAGPLKWLRAKPSP